MFSRLSFSIDALSTPYTAYTFANQADVLVNTRHAASALGATKMDRPEWLAIDQATRQVYCTLTNNSQWHQLLDNKHRALLLNRLWQKISWMN